jgi:ubiquinone/menaquinone biosynthesis C-methylase UbiE
MREKSTGPPGVPQDRERVVDEYDRLILFCVELGDGSLHQGYWDSPADSATLGEAGQRLTDLLVGKLGVGPGDRVLDIGCGIGGPAIRLAQSTGASVIGISNGPGQVQQATRNAADAGVGDRVGFQCADAMDLPFPDNSFNAAWMFESIMAMPDRLAALRQAARVLTPGSRLVLTDLLNRGAERAAMAQAMEKTEENAALFGLPPTSHVPIRLADYEPLLEQAGLIPGELLDISEHTVAATYAAIRRRLTDNRQQFVEKRGSWPVELYELNLPVVESMDMGYGLIVATVPEQKEA